MPNDSIMSRNYVLNFFANLSIAGGLNYLIPVLPIFFRNMGLSNSAIGILLSTYSFSAIFLRPVSGRMVSKYGSRNIMFVGCMILFLLIPMYSLFHSIPALFIVRLIHGIGMAAFVTGTAIFVAEVSPVNKMAQAYGVFTVSVSVAAGAAPVLGSFLSEKLSVYLFFGVPAVLALVAIALVMAITEGRPPEGQYTQPADFMSVLKNRHVWLPGITLITCAFTIGVINAFLPLHLLNVRNASAPLFYAIYSISLILIRFFAGGLSDKIGRKKVVIPSTFLVAAGLAGLAFVQGPISLSISAVIYGFGYGLIYPNMAAVVIDNIEEANRGMSMGVFSASFEVGLFLGPFIMGFVSEVVGFETMFLLTSIPPIAGLIFFWYQYQEPKKAEKSFNH